MKKLLYLLLSITLFTACSSDDDNDNVYCWELIQYTSASQDSHVTDVICDKTEKEMKEYVRYWNDIIQKSYDKGELDYLKWFEYRRQ